MSNFTTEIEGFVEKVSALNIHGDIETSHPEVFTAFKAFALKLTETVQNIEATS